MELTTGITGKVEITVSNEDTAAKWGSGLVPVYSTPALVGLLESAAVQALQGYLAEGKTTVGGRIDVKHMAATPVGMKVHALAELVEIDGRRLVFKVQAWDEAEQIGEAVHERYIIDEAKFLARVQAKTI